MNVSVLTKVAQSSKTADLVFKYLAGRERGTWSMNLSRVYAELTKDGKTISREAFNQVFETLQKAGAGTIVHGRRGGANRFMWNYNFRQAADQTLKSLKAQEPKPSPKANVSSVQPTVIQLTLPSTMSQKDIQALIELVQGAKS